MGCGLRETEVGERAFQSIPNEHLPQGLEMEKDMERQETGLEHLVPSVELQELLMETRKTVNQKQGGSELI